MAKVYENKKFLKRLSSEQLKTLVALCVLESDKQKNMTLHELMINSIDDIYLTCSPRKDWDVRDYVFIQAFIGKGMPATSEFMVDDFSLKMMSGYYEKYFNSVLHSYFTCIFGEEYVDYLFAKRVSDAIDEKNNLLACANEKSDNLGLQFIKTKN